jgi:hypothetical protein
VGRAGYRRAGAVKKSAMRIEPRCSRRPGDLPPRRARRSWGTLTAARPPFCRWMRASSQSTPRRYARSGGRLKPTGAGSRTPGSMRLRRERHDRRRARDNPAQRSARLGGLLSRMRGPAVCDPPRIASEQLAPWRMAVGRLRRERTPPVLAGGPGYRPTLQRAFGSRWACATPGEPPRALATSPG